LGGALRLAASDLRGGEGGGTSGDHFLEAWLAPNARLYGEGQGWRGLCEGRAVPTSVDAAPGWSGIVKRDPSRAAASAGRLGAYQAVAGSAIAPARVPWVLQCEALRAPWSAL